MDKGNDSDYGLSSGDESDLEALAVQISTPPSLKRRAPQYDRPSPKRQRVISPKDQPLSASQQSITSAIKHAPLSSPTYPATSALAVRTLKTHFRLQGFRLKQEAAIARLLAGGSAVVVFPTGGGKSLCYQVPAFAFAEADLQENVRESIANGGISLVVSPLIALMKDQVDALKRKGLNAACLDSTKTREEFLQTMEGMRNGTLKLLYCAPERLNNEAFVASIKHCPGGIRLVAVDEAHCISEWGHAFRPNFLKVARFTKEIEAERVVCLTATATPKVAQDICDAFNIDESGLFRTATYRPNLRLHAEAAATKRETYPRLFDFLKGHPGSTIIYVTLQQHSVDLANLLRSNGFAAKAFHAGMEASVKAKLQDDFMQSNSLIMVATIAFGMGIDKANIRNVIHFDIPRSLEGYSQEIGRAGRDEQPSHCLLYLCGEDLHIRESFARGDVPSKESVRNLLQDVFDANSAKLCPGDAIERRLYEQSKDLDIRPTTLNSIYAQLELRFGLIRAVTPRYSGYSYVVENSSHIAMDTSPAATAIKLSSRQAKKWTSIDVDQAAQRQQLDRLEIIRKLQDWSELGVIELKTSGVINIYRVLQKLPSTPAEIEQLVDALYNELQARETQELNRMREVNDLLTGSECFARSLAQHFGDDLPDQRTECGHCTWCETHQPVRLITAPPVPWDRERFTKVLKAVEVRDDARFLARVAFGISSPRVTAMKLSNDPVFGSMADHDFTKLYNAFVTCCASANQNGWSSDSSQDSPSQKAMLAKSTSKRTKAPKSISELHLHSGARARGGRRR